MKIEDYRFERKLSRGKSAVTVAIPPLFLELMEAQDCKSVYVSIEGENRLRLEMIRP